MNNVYIFLSDGAEGPIRLDDDDASVLGAGDNLSLKRLYELLGCRFVEVFSPGGLAEGSCFWLDEEGRLTGRPVNVLASLLAQTVIVGPVLVEVRRADADRMQSVIFDLRRQVKQAKSA